MVSMLMRQTDRQTLYFQLEAVSVIIIIMIQFIWSCYMSESLHGI